MLDIHLTVPHKTCPSCKQTYPLTAEWFTRDKNRLNGLYPLCKKCRHHYRLVHQDELRKKAKDRRDTQKESFRIRKRKYYLAHKEQINEQHRKYRIAHRDAMRKKAKEYRETYKTSLKEKNKVYYVQNKEKITQKRKLYLKRNPHIFRALGKKRRARELGAAIQDFTHAQWMSMLDAYNYRCVYCPATCWRCQRKRHALTQDHITPLSKGGNHTLSNIVPACQSCNSKKKDGAILRPVQPLLCS